MKAIEASGHINKDGALRINSPAHLKAGDVRVIIMYDSEEEQAEDKNWYRFVGNNPAFNFLKEPEEDIYTPLDGKPLTNEE